MELARINGMRFINSIEAVNSGETKMDSQLVEDIGLVDALGAIIVGLTRVGKVTLRAEEVLDPDTEETVDVDLIFEVDSYNEELEPAIDSVKEEMKALIAEAFIAKEEETP